MLENALGGPHLETRKTIFLNGSLGFEIADFFGAFLVLFFAESDRRRLAVRQPDDFIDEAFQKTFVMGHRPADFILGATDLGFRLGRPPQQVVFTVRTVFDRDGSTPTIIDEIPQNLLLVVS